MSTIQDNDQFLVQRGSNSYKQSAKDLMSTIQDTDYMLVQRGAGSFKVTCEDVKDQLGGGDTPQPPVLASVTLNQEPPVDTNRFTGKSFMTTAVNSGGAATELLLTGEVTGELGLKAGSDPITTNSYPGAPTSSVALTLDGTTNLGNVIKEGDVVTASASYTPVSDEIERVEVITVDTVNKLFKGSFTAGDGFKFVGFYDASDNPVVVPEPDYVSIPPSQTTENPFTSPVGYADPNAGWFWDAATLGAGQNVILSWSTPIDKVITQARIGGFVGGNTVIAVWSMSGGLEVESTFNTISNIGAQPIIDATNQTEVTTLTLSDKKDIELFQAGDVVQGNPAWNQTQMWSEKVT